MSYITLVTRIKTLNIGNEALSTELIKAVSDYSNDEVLALERAPNHLSQFSFSKLRGKSEFKIDSTVNKWVYKLVGLSAGELQDFKSSIELVYKKSEPKRISKIRGKLKLRGWLAKTGYYSRQYSNRLRNFSESRVVLLNPAGELNPMSIDPPLRMLVELLAAKELGAKVGITNFSYEIDDSDVNKVLVKLFNRLDFIYVRDQLSLNLLNDLGVHKSLLRLVPDLVFMSVPESNSIKVNNICKEYGIDHSSVIVVINGKTGLSDVKDWAKVIDVLRDRGLKPIIMSNELSSDIKFAMELKKISGVDVVERQFSYKTYSEVVGRANFIVSNRLHTSILALTANTPVIPVEPILRKIRGVFGDFGYPLSVPSVREEGWVDQVVSNIDFLIANRDFVLEISNARLSETRSKIIKNYKFI